MGIWAILSGEFGELQARVLGTTLTIVGTSILGLACGAYLEAVYSRETPLKIVPLAGIFLTILSALITLWMIWGNGTMWEGNGVFKTLIVSIIFSFSLAQLSLLSLARLARRFRWVTTTAYVVVFLLASIVSVIVVFNPESEDSLVARMIGVLAVMDAAITVMIPIFHRLSRSEFTNDEEAVSIDRINAEIDKLRAQVSRLEKQKEDIMNAKNGN